MELSLDWSRIVPLKDGAKLKLIYAADLAKLPSAGGVYVFGRQWSSKFEALYVGKANNIRSRVKSQLNNLRLMQHLKTARTGKRIILAGTFVQKQGQQLGNCLPLIERALIRHFLSEGHDLVNKHGTRINRHEIHSSGKHPKRFFSREIYLER